MRSSCCASVAGFMVVLGVAFSCFAQNPPSPATLESLASPGNAQIGNTPDDDAIGITARPQRTAGTVARPEGGEQHPDLDKAWREYDETVAKAVAGIKAVIVEQFKNATKKGELEAAEKWQAALAGFENAGELPSGSEAKQAVTTALAEYKKAKEKLSKAYESVRIALTMEEKVIEARRVADEWQSLGGHSRLIVIEAKDYVSDSNAVKGEEVIRQSPKWDNLTIPASSTLQWNFETPAAGSYFIHVSYASGQPRPCDVAVNGKIVARGVLAQKTGGFMKSNLRWETIGPFQCQLRNAVSIDPVVHSPHLSRIVISQHKDPPQRP